MQNQVGLNEIQPAGLAPDDVEDGEARGRKLRRKLSCLVPGIATACLSLTLFAYYVAVLSFGLRDLEAKTRAVFASDLTVRKVGAAESKAAVASRILSSVGADLAMLATFAEQFFEADVSTPGASPYVPQPILSGLSKNVNYSTAVSSDKVAFYARDFTTTWPAEALLGTGPGPTVLKQASLLQVPMLTLRKRGYISTYFGVEPPASFGQVPVFVTHPYRNLDHLKLFHGRCDARSLSDVKGLYVPSCDESSTSFESSACGFDPRCQPWYNNAAQASRKSSAVYTPIFQGNVVVGMTASRAVWSSNRSTLKGVLGIDFAIDNLRKILDNATATIMKSGYNFLASSNLTVVMPDEAAFATLSSNAAFDAMAEPELVKQLGNIRCGASEASSVVINNRGVEEWVLRTAPINATLQHSPCPSSEDVGAMLPPVLSVVTVSSVTDAFEISGYMGKGEMLAACCAWITVFVLVVARTYYILDVAATSLTEKFAEDSAQLVEYIERCVNRDFHPGMGNALDPNSEFAWGWGWGWGGVEP